MKKILIAACFVSVAAASCNDSGTKKEEAAAKDSSTASTAVPAENPTAAAVLDSATKMKNWMAYMTPGQMHKMMQSWDGTWDAELTSWYEPGLPPQISKGKAVNKMMYDGRYQLSTVTADMQGMPFEGTSIVAYDNAKKKFISTWFDNMGTGIMNMEGTWDEASKSMTLTGKGVDPSAGNDKLMEMKEIFKIIDDKHQLMEMYCPGPDGKEFKMMEVKFTRK